MRRTHAPALEAPPAPVTPSPGTADPTRSTVGLVSELWEAETDERPFPPPAAPAIADVSSRFGWWRLLVTVLLLVGVGIGAYLGTGWWLDQRSASMVAHADAVLVAAGGTATGLEGAATRIADPDATVVELSAVSEAIIDLEADVVALRAIADPEEPWVAEVGVTLPDPIAGRRTAVGVLAEWGGAVADDVGDLLASRLLVDRLPDLPDLPSGADDRTIDGIAADLTSAVTSVHDAVDVLHPTVAEAVAPLAVDFEHAVTDYVVALRADDPAAEDLAVDLRRIHASIQPTTMDAIADLAAPVDETIATYAAAVASVGR